MSNCKTFSLLDKDQKTYNHILEYYNGILNNVSVFSIDMILQKRELTEHLQRCTKEHDKDEICKWLEKNASPFRCYLNSLKSVALFCIMDRRINSKNNLSWDNFCKIVDIWREEKQLIIDTIKFEG